MSILHHHGVKTRNMKIWWRAYCSTAQCRRLICCIKKHNFYYYKTITCHGNSLLHVALTLFYLFWDRFIRCKRWSSAGCSHAVCVGGVLGEEPEHLLKGAAHCFFTSLVTEAQNYYFRIIVVIKVFIGLKSVWDRNYVSFVTRPGKAQPY